MSVESSDPSLGATQALAAGVSGLGATVAKSVETRRSADGLAATRISQDRAGSDESLERTRVAYNRSGAALQGDSGGAIAETAVADVSLTDRGGARPPTDSELLELENVAERFQIGRYTVLRKLGEGGMGVVYSALDPELDRRVAIKVVRTTIGGDTIGRGRMQREAQAMARLSHPNVVQVHDVGEFQGQVFLAMEYVRGETLSEWQARQDPAQPESRRAIIETYIQAGQGLSAAHKRDLVHRDFKPDNVLVDAEDGRPRVLDFGLAASRGEAGAPRAALAKQRDSVSGLGVSLTRTGAVMGTPAYMSPEQFLARPTDARTDQFSFCVALYEALHGESPFPGETYSELRDAVTSGVPRDPPEGSHWPLSLRAILVRGMARRPGDRYESMDALLELLAYDPDEARRQRRRVIAALVLVALLSGLVIAAGVKGWALWEERQREADAMARLGQLNTQLDALTAAGDREAAARFFKAFIESPENFGTRALGRAWLDQASREASDDAEASVSAFAAAYTVATSPGDQDAALVGLAQFFREQWMLDSLVRAMAARRAIVGGARSGSTTEVADLELDAAYARADFDAAAELLTGPLRDSPRAVLLPVTRALSRAAPSGLEKWSPLTAVDLDGDGVEELAGRGARNAALTVVRADMSLTPLGPYAAPNGALIFVPMGKGQATRLAISAGDTITLMRLVGDAFVEEHQWEDHSAYTALAHDLDGDGVEEVFVGTGPYTRHLLELRDQGPDASPRWSVEQASSAIDRRRSDVTGLAAADLDGDGREELAVALGPWTAYELQVLRRAPNRGAMTRVARVKLGSIRTLRLLRRADGPTELLLVKRDEFRNPAVFPKERAFGEPAGLYAYRLRDEALERTAFIPDPRFTRGALQSHEIHAADLDGDGREEIVVSRLRTGADKRPPSWVTEILVRVPGEDGAFEAIRIEGVRLVTAGDLDGDGDDEAVLAVFHRDDGQRFGGAWIVGGGDGRLETAAGSGGAGVALEPAPAPASGSDATIVQMWRHANELGSMGLDLQAADAFEAIGTRAGETSLGARAVTTAARLHEGRGDNQRACELYGRALDDASQGTEAAEGALRCHLQRGEYAEALAAVVRILDDAASLDPEARARIHRHRAQLDALRSETIDFGRPLDGWQIERPLAFQRDGVAGAVHVEAIDPGRIASAALQRAPGPQSLQVTFELSRVEWNAGVWIGVVPEGATKRGESTLAVGVQTMGGGGELRHAFTCAVGGPERNFATLPLAADDVFSRRRRVTLRVLHNPTLESRSCYLWDEDGNELAFFTAQTRSEHDADTSQGPARLTIEATRAPGTWASVRIDELRLWGMKTAGDAAPQDSSLPHRLAERDFTGALRLLSEAAGGGAPGAREDGRHALWRAYAYAELGRFHEAAAALAPVVSSAAPKLDEAAARTLRTLARTRPRELYALLREAADPVRATLEVVQNWEGASRNGLSDPLPAATLALAVADLESLEIDRRDRLALLGIRARIRQRAGDDRGADADRRAVIALLDDPALESQPSDREGWRVDARAEERFALAASALRRGDREAARALIEQVFAEASDPLRYVDLMNAQELFADLRDGVARPAP